MDIKYHSETSYSALKGHYTVQRQGPGNWVVEEIDLVSPKPRRLGSAERLEAALTFLDKYLNGEIGG